MKNIMELDDIPVIDVQAYFDKTSGKYEEECQKVAQSFHQFGIILFKDPRVKHEHNEEYLNMMEKYFQETGRKYYAGEELKDMRPELNYQTGVTPENVEKAKNHANLLSSIPDEHKPMSTFPPKNDAKWRFFYPIGDRPKEVVNDCPKIFPAEFPEWEEKMDNWGNMMVNAAYTAAEMCALGMGIDKNTFTEKMNLAPHLLAPTASDLQKYDVGTAFANFHYDLNFITVHGKSRYPGLYIWTRNWTKMPVKIPQGCLLLQAGIMLEHLTGGYILAGYHEVIYTDKTKEVLMQKIKENEEENKGNVLWRISSTLFSHLRYNVDLTPIDEVSHLVDINQARNKYCKMTAHEKLMDELRAINLVPKLDYKPNQEQEGLNIQEKINA